MQAVILDDGVIQAGEIHPELIELYPVRAMLLDDAEIDEVMAFYAAHAHYGLRYPHDPQWVKAHIGVDFFLFGIKARDELIAVAWIAKKRDFVYFVLKNDCLILENNGAFADSGGWCVRPDYQGKGLFQLLTATVISSFWFTWIHRGRAPLLWGRMMGSKDDDGNPLFWNRVGEAVTGLSYRALLELPFGSMEGAIFAHWPREPIPVAEIPREIVAQTLGKSLGRLVEPKNRFVQWGLTEVSDRLVPTSLNYFVCATENSIRDPAQFFREAFSRVVRKLEDSA